MRKPYTSAVLVAICLLFVGVVRAEHDATAVNASVAIFNPPSSLGTCGSGTICGRTATHLVGVGAAHCFVGNIGGKFSVGAPDGKRFPATLVAHDKVADLALFTTEFDATTAVAFPAVCDAEDFAAAKRISICGYPAGKGPTYDSRVAFVRKVSEGGRDRYEWHTDLRIEGGSSGCGVFADGHLIGVVRAANWKDGGDGKCVYSVSNEDLTAFLAQCGPNGCWSPKPNVPVTPRPRDLNSDNKMGWEIHHLRERLGQLEQQPAPQPPMIREAPSPPPEKPASTSPLMVLGALVSAAGAGMYLVNAKRAG